MYFKYESQEPNILAVKRPNGDADPVKIGEIILGKKPGVPAQFIPMSARAFSTDELVSITNYMLSIPILKPVTETKWRLTT